LDLMGSRNLFSNKQNWLGKAMTFNQKYSKALTLDGFYCTVRKQKIK
jgi:hypothetical protein